MNINEERMFATVLEGCLDEAEEQARRPEFEPILAAGLTREELVDLKENPRGGWALLCNPRIRAHVEAFLDTVGESLADQAESLIMDMDDNKDKEEV